MIQVHDLWRSFGPTVALHGVELNVLNGEFLTIFGPNGAGKTTLLRILATLLRPTRGVVTINGLDLRSGALDIRRQIGFLSHRPLVYGNLTVEENLLFYGRLYDVPALRMRIDAMLARLELDEHRHCLAGGLSRGTQQRLALGRALIHNPPLLLLDEPYTGLDPLASNLLTTLLRQVHGEGCTVVMTSHDLVRGLELCTRLVILARGRVAHTAQQAGLTVAELERAYNACALAE